ncbi:DUF1236 domain-containing protein [Pararhizobium mangrovi]|uniref:DUF1236 domain-containing protein n=1 Tax=Pararhizobium mangrovi TaxID=2590452 RepID=A0A506U5C5_9HYPH|nr:DUF1236 domain-containing protein [Pararhizobium mangrovi]TPW28658.1 DUF1236 domain-containing protein [Pararhizobium mangrovi]
MKRFFASAGIVSIALAGSAACAFAATSATATANLNVRSGPGPQYAASGVIRNGDEVTVDGCIQNSQWCRVSYDGGQGWAYARYLTATYENRTVVIEDERDALGVPQVTYEAPADAPNPTIDGELIGRVDDTDSFPPPPDTVRTYVVDNRRDPVYLDGEVVVGAGIPDTVDLAPVPDSDYDYAYVNDQPVVVDPDSRRIVYVYR